MTALCNTASAGPLTLITDFSREPGGLEWFVVNDDVMGGKSSGGFELNDGNLVFTGSTDTRGGPGRGVRLGYDPNRSQALRLTGSNVDQTPPDNAADCAL